MKGQDSFWLDAGKEPDRYKHATLWYDSTDERLVVLVDGKRVPVVEPVLPGLEIIPDPPAVPPRHIQWNEPVDAWALDHLPNCEACQAKFKRNEFVGIRQAGGAAWSTRKP